jgi:hypothetical protein
MQYYLSAYVEDCRIAEKYHEVSVLFNNLTDAETYYNQFNGKEIYNEEILINDLHEIRYVIKIDEYLNGNIVYLIKAKYKVLDLESFHPDFWDIFNFLSSESANKKTNF